MGKDFCFCVCILSATLSENVYLINIRGEGKPPPDVDCCLSDSVVTSESLFGMHAFTVI